MPPPDLRASVDAIRDEAALACEHASLRSVAREIGLSAMGLRAFINRAHEPQKGTLHKLNLWYASRAAAREARGEASARTALALLAGLYPPADRPRVTAGLVDLMEREFRASRMPPPPWLATLAEELGRDGDAPGPARG